MKDKFQYAVPDHSDAELAELALNIRHFFQPPSPKSHN